MIRLNYSKVRAKSKTVDGIRFASTAEARRYTELKLAQMGLEIESLVCHPSFVLKVNGYDVCAYTPDFQYWDRARGRWVIEEVKGGYTKAGIGRDYPIRAKLFQALNPQFLLIEVRA